MSLTTSSGRGPTVGSQDMKATPLQAIDQMAARWAIIAVNENRWIAYICSTRSGVVSLKNESSVYNPGFAHTSCAERVHAHARERSIRHSTKRQNRNGEARRSSTSDGLAERRDLHRKTRAE